MRSSRYWLLAAVLTALVLLNGRQADQRFTTDETSVEVVAVGFDNEPGAGGDQARAEGHLSRFNCPPQLRKWLAFIIDFYSRLTRQQRPLVRPLRL